MHFSKLLIPLLAAPLASAIVITGKVNFYYDNDCKDFAGSEYPSPTSPSEGCCGNVRGGPSGSKAIKWVYGETGENCQPPYYFACKNAKCTAADGVSIGQCKSFTNGIWAAYQELCPVGE